MVEIIEYSLVIMTSFLFAGYGVYLFADYSRYVKQSSLNAAYYSILSASWSSIESDSERRVVVFLNNVTLGCYGGVLTLSSGSYKVSNTIPANCNFTFPGITGLRRLVVRGGSGTLTLQVDH